MSTFVTLEIEFPSNEDAQGFSGWLSLEGYHRKTFSGNRVTVVLSSHGSRFAVITEARKRGSTIIIEGAKDDHESELQHETLPNISRPSGRKEMHLSGRVDIQWERKDGVLVAAVIGRVDGSTAAEFHQLLESGIEPGDTALILDLEKLTFISSPGLRVGLIFARKFNEPGKRFGVCTLPTHIRGVIAVSGFDQLIAVYESRAAALSAITEGQP